jgi:hypothetical protein
MKARISSFPLILLKQVPQGSDELFMHFVNLSAPGTRVQKSFFFETAGELRFFVLEKWGGPQQDPHSYGDQI